MASYLPPTDNLPIFDSSVFDSNNTSYLTYTTAKKLFLTYPTAQGEETIASLIAGAIAYSSPLSGSFFNIGINQVSGGTVRIGPTGTSGVSVHAGNIDCTNNTINNATSPTAGDLSLGNTQTTGVLNLGTGTRVTGANGGAINIGTGASVTAPINIGGGASTSGSINIGQIGSTTGTTTTNINTSTVGSHPVNIGSSTALTTINGASTLTGLATATTGLKTTSITSDTTLSITPTTSLSLGTSTSTSVGIGASGITTTINGPSTLTGLATATAGLTLGSGKGITCGGAVYSPALTNTQIGYSTVIQNTAQVNLTSTSQTILTSSNTLPIGVYLIAVNMNVQTWSPAALTNYLTMTWSATTGCSVNIIPLACAGTNTLTSCTFSGVLTVTSATNTITLAGATNVGGYTCVIPFVSSVGYAQMSVCRIA